MEVSWPRVRRPGEASDAAEGLAAALGCSTAFPLGFRLPWHPISVGCALIIPMIIQTIGLYPSGAVWTDEAGSVSRLDPSGAVQVDANHPTRNRKVEGSTPTSGSTDQQVSGRCGAPAQ